MKYTFEIAVAPEEIIVEANNITEAKQKAKEVFASSNNGSSIYTIECIDAE